MITTGVLQRPRAGRRAEREYKRRRAAWRRVVWKRLAVATWPLIVIGLVGYFMPLPAQWAWVAGLMAGAGVTLWLALWTMAPQRIENWWQGAEGERRTEDALRPLEAEGWRVAHDLRKGRFNIDHVVIGPGGVFLLDSKNYEGDVTVQGDDVRVVPAEYLGGPWTQLGLGRRVRGNAAEMNKHLRRSTNLRPWVQGVVVLWSPVEGRVVDGDRVTFLQGTELADWLRSQPPRLSPDRVATIADELRAT